MATTPMPRRTGDMDPRLFIYVDRLAVAPGTFTGALLDGVVRLRLNLLGTGGAGVQRQTLRAVASELGVAPVLRDAEVHALRNGPHCFVLLVPGRHIDLSAVPDGIANDWTRAGAARGRA